MKLLARTVQDLRRLSAPDVVFGAAVLAVVVAVELLGRHTATDLHDLMALMALALVGALVGLRHRRRPLPWVSALGALLARFGAYFDRPHSRSASTCGARRGSGGGRR